MRMPGWSAAFSKERFVQLAIVSCYATIALLSSVPGGLRPHVPGFSDKLEHLVAFFLLGAVTVLAAPRESSRGRLLAMVVAYAAVLELGQMFIPGREPSLADWGASSVGAILGVTTALMIPIATGKKPGLARRQNPKTSIPT